VTGSGRFAHGCENSYGIYGKYCLLLISWLGNIENNVAGEAALVSLLFGPELFENLF
jgi:hypothetical protein